MRRVILLMVLALGVSVARADNGSFYFGAGISRNKLSNVTNSTGSYPDIDNSSSWKVFAGFRPISLFAVEADYLDLGSGTNIYRAHTDAQTFAGYAVGFVPIPLPFLDIYGKAGLARWKLNGSIVHGIPAGITGFSDQGTAFAWGVGVQGHISMFGARLEYENFNIPNTGGAKVASLSVFLNL